MAYNYYHQSKIWLLRSMIGCIALVGCNTHNTRLGMAPTARDHTVSTGIDEARASLASHDASQEVPVIPQEEFIVQKNQLIKAKEQEIAAVHTEIGNIALSRDTLIQTNKEKRISIKAKQEDTDHMRTRINKNSNSYTPRVKCTSCGVHERIPQFLIEEIIQKYDVDYSQWVERTWKWSIFSGSSYSCVVSDREFKHCFRCLNKSDIRQWEREINNNETRLNTIQDNMNAEHSRLAALNSEKEGIASDIAAYTRQINRAAAIEAQRKSEEKARKKAEQDRKEANEKAEQDREEANKKAAAIEAQRKSEEEARKKAEQDREEANKKAAAIEVQRKSEEEARKKAEQDREEANEKAAAIEAQRKSEEKARKKAEQGREEATKKAAAIEAQRKSEEEARKKAEQDREEANKKAVAIEAQRKSEEEARKKAEQDREEANEKASAIEAQRKSEEKARKKAEQDREEANKKAVAIEAQRKSEEEARKKAEQACKEKDDKIAALESQLAMRGGNPYMDEHTANQFLGDGNEATVLINRKNRNNASEVLSLNVRRVGHNGVQREESDTSARATHELYEQMAWGTPGDLQHIAYADSDDEDKKMPAIAVQEQTQANILDTPRSRQAIRHAHPTNNYTTTESGTNRYVSDIVCNMIRKNYPTEVICDLTGYTLAQVESLRRDVDFPQEINAPREDDDVTTLTSQGNISAQFPLAASMEPEELAETELIAFGSLRDEYPEEQVVTEEATEGEGEQASTQSFTILSSNESLESEL